MTKEELEKMMEEDRKLLTQRYIDKFKSQTVAMQKQGMKKIKKLED